LNEVVTQPRLISEKAAADYLGVAYRTLWGWRKQGRISHIRFGSAVRYSRDDLDDFIQANRIQV
jgi:excisionase family DNA binding protein